MNNAMNTRRIDSTLPGPTAAQLRNLRQVGCYHLSVIELGDGARVCTHCEKVLK